MLTEIVFAQELQDKMALKAQQLLQQQQLAGVTGPGPPSQKASSGGIFNMNFQALIHTILGNLQLRLTNVHIR